MRNLFAAHGTPWAVRADSPKCGADDLDMALPAHLSPYESLLDLRVEAVIRKVGQCAEEATAGGLIPAAASLETMSSDGDNHGNHSTAAPTAES